MNDALIEHHDWHSNPLLRGMIQVAKRVLELKTAARNFYYTVLLCAHPCPACGGQLQMIEASKCRCQCGVTLDPTVEFQRSPCCGASLQRKMLHYVCAACHRIVPSKFLFDERLFDPAYFREKMQESRENRKKKIEALRQMLADSRSNALCLTETPDLGSIPRLEMDLNDFIGSMDMLAAADFLGGNEFRMSECREAILDAVPAGCLIRFSAIPALCENRRLDRARKFITLLFMDQAHEVELTQDAEDLVVERYDETD